MPRKGILTVALGLCVMIPYAQQAIPASGGEASGGGTVSYTVGQVLYSTNSDASNSEAQGVQQPYEISNVTGIEDQEGISLSFTVYPNPSNAYLNLKVENYDLNNLEYQLYDVTGKLLVSQSVVNSTTTIKMENYAPANYLLNIVSDGKTIETFKIIKN